MKAYISQLPTEELVIRLPNEDGTLPEETHVGNWQEYDLPETTIEAIRFATPEQVKRILQQIIS